MKPIRLTDALVAKLTPPESGQLIVWDRGPKRVAGFGIRITAKGARAFFLNYRNADGRTRRYTIGSPGGWSVDAARKRAAALKREIEGGADPLAARIEAREAPTVADLCDRYEETVLPRKRPSTQASYRSIIKNIIRPKLGALKVSAVRREDVDKIHRNMDAAPYQANRALALMSVLFSFAVEQLEWRANNPCVGVERFQEDRRERYLRKDELARLIEALAAYPAERAAKVDHTRPNAKAMIGREMDWGRRAASAILLCVFTGCRRGEALSAAWNQFDFEGGIWTKPGSTTKQKTMHAAPLSTPALAMLKRLYDAAPKDATGKPSSRYVFPGKTPDAPIADLKAEWAALRIAAGIPDVRLHDLRHTFASIAASGGASLPMIGRLLGHSNPVTTHRYAHLFHDPLREVADQVGAIVSGTKIKSTEQS